MSFRIRRFTACCAGLLLSFGAVGAEFSALKGDWKCEQGHISIDFTLTNSSGADIEILQDRLPWSPGPGGAKVEIEELPSGENVVAIRRSTDFSTFVRLKPGDTHGTLDVDSILPLHNEFVARHGRAVLSWSYLLSSGPHGIGTGSGIVITASDADHCYSAPAAK